MGLFRKDLYRAFLIGFLIGTAGLVASMGGDARAQIVAHVAQFDGAQFDGPQFDGAQLK